MNLRIDMIQFKKIIILFWTLWWLSALWTEVIGGLAHLGWLQASWAPDLNYPFLVHALKIYHVPNWVPVCLFVGIIFWLLLSAGLFFWASMGLNNKPVVWMQRAHGAFITSLTLWFVFFLADQMVMKFDLEQNHMVQGGFELLCYMVVYFLPDTFSKS